MLTLTRRRGWSIYSLSHEGVSGKGIHGLRPESLHAGRPEVPGSGSSGQVPAGFRAIQRVGALEAGLDSGGQRFRAGRRVRGPEVPG